MLSKLMQAELQGVEPSHDSNHELHTRRSNVRFEVDSRPHMYDFPASYACRLPFGKVLRQLSVRGLSWQYTVSVLQALWICTTGSHGSPRYQNKVNELHDTK